MMTINFDPRNEQIQELLKGILLEEKDEIQEANKIYYIVWNNSKNSFEKYLASYFIAQTSNEEKEKLQWYLKTLEIGKTIEDYGVTSAFSNIYKRISECYIRLNDIENAKKNIDLASLFQKSPEDKGPFYHGTKADLKVGDLLLPARTSNYKENLIMNHIYFTSNLNGAGLAASLSKGTGEERVYIVKPLGAFENDPNVTDKKFPGNVTRSFRSESPLEIVGVVKDWNRHSGENIANWRKKLEENKGEIIN